MRKFSSLQLTWRYKMRKKGNSKLFKAMMLSAMAMMIVFAHRASAEEAHIYKEPAIKMNQSADIAPNLRSSAAV